MAALEDLKPNAAVRGVLPTSMVTVVSVQWFGSEALELTYKEPAGKVANELLYRHDEPRLEVVEEGRPWSFDGDGALFRLVSEAQRIRLAHLFDPVLAVHTSVVEPLPHQITAVYEAMLPRQPLRFLLADDPGAGKTIMAGLLIKELIARGDLQRCLIVCPGSLAEQWQDELYRRFHLPFEILTNDKLEAARTGNWFLETNLVIARLDKLSRNEDVQQKLQAPDCRWDLVVCDEAHKMSATFFGGEIKYTKRYRLGQLLSTPDAALPADDGDAAQRQGRGLPALHGAARRRPVRGPVPRRRPRGRRLGPDAPDGQGEPAQVRRHAALPRAHRLHRPLQALGRRGRSSTRRSPTTCARSSTAPRRSQNDKRAGTVGFALTILQRRLASSPEAIYQSLRRRRERLEKPAARAGAAPARRRRSRRSSRPTLPALDAEDVEDLEEAPDDEVEAAEEEILDQATAARSIAELKIEIETLKRLEALAAGGPAQRRRTRSGASSRACSARSSRPAPSRTASPSRPCRYGAGRSRSPMPSPRQKLVLFTEHRDTLNYLESRIATLLGRAEAVVIIHGGMGREERLKAQESFRHDPEVQVLLATDAAGEGINLQRAHLMVNYDLPWNPNRLEQRFGRIHRIGQTEVCHLWNLVAEETREGDVYRRLLEKLEEARQALGGQVFDVLGKLQFEGRPLRELLIEAIRYGDQPEVRARLTHGRRARASTAASSQDLLEERALAHDAMDASRVQRIREEMERAEARRLQPHYIESFFLEAFQRLGGTAKQREPRRYEVTHVPAPVRNRDRLIGIGEPVLPRYERIAFEKALVAPQGQPLAAFVCPGHPLLDAVIDLTLERHRDLLRRGAVLVDERDAGHAAARALLPRARDPGREPHPQRRAPRRLQADALRRDRRRRRRRGTSTTRPTSTTGRWPRASPASTRSSTRPECAWIGRELEQQGAGLRDRPRRAGAPRGGARAASSRWIDKTEAAVKDRLTKEITYWDHRAEQLKLQEQAGKANARLNSGEARKRADDLQARLQKRLEELEREAPDLAAAAGGARRPAGRAGRACSRAMTGRPTAPTASRVDTQASAARARAIVMEIERGLGFEPTDREFEKLGYDIESRVPGTGKLRFIEVKGRVIGRRHDHRDEERDPLLAQQAGRLHPRDRRVPRWRRASRPLPAPPVSREGHYDGIFRCERRFSVQAADRRRGCSVMSDEGNAVSIGSRETTGSRSSTSSSRTGRSLTRPQQAPRSGLSGDTSGVFDKIECSSAHDAEAALIRNGFRRFANDASASDIMTPPAPPFHRQPHPNGPIYSSGRFWK